MTDDDQGLGPTSHSYISQRLRLHYVDWGNPNRAAAAARSTAGGTIAGTGTGWRANLRNVISTSSPRTCAAMATARFRPSGDYSMNAFVYDIAQLIHQQGLAPLRIVAHSMGGSIALRYSGVFPENVLKLVAIEGLGRSPRMEAERAKRTPEQRLTRWIEAERNLAGRLPRRYASIDEALARMQGENKHLTPAQARYLTIHGVSQNEDGTYSWKFDNYVRSEAPLDLPTADLHHLWSRIACPTLLVYGKESWASNPVKDGRIAHFQNATVETFEGAGHWVHHDRLDAFVAMMREFL